MWSNFNDDESVITFHQAENFTPGRVAARIISKRDARLERTAHTTMVELMGFETNDQTRCGVDIVTLLDVSRTMDGIKLDKLKTCIKFLINKLTPIDRLSIVTFSSQKRRLCPLTRVTKKAQAKLESMIDNLTTKTGSNIMGGVDMALKVLRERKYTEGRTSAVMVISNGVQNSGFPQPSSGYDVPIYTFGLGSDHDSQMLHEIARKSNKGTYSVVDVEGSESSSLNTAFSSCLAALMSVVVEDLELIITPAESEIMNVRVGNYDQTRDNESVKISFGNLYNCEKRNITVNLNLPAVSSETESEILRIAYSFRSSGAGGEFFEAPPLFCRLTRSASPVSVEPPEIINEVASGNITDAMKTARELADANNFDGAKTTLKDAQKSLDALKCETHDLIKALKYEIQVFYRLLKDPETYQKEGRAFALSSELSHSLQRFAARGDGTQLLPFVIPLAAPFLYQSRNFDENVTTEELITGCGFGASSYLCPISSIQTSVATS